MKWFKIKVSQKQREWVSLALRVVEYAFICLWDLLFLCAALLVFNNFISIIPRSGVFILLPVWYLVTVVYIAVWVVDWGYKRIGKWEWARKPKNKKQEVK